MFTRWHHLKVEDSQVTEPMRRPFAGQFEEGAIFWDLFGGEGVLLLYYIDEKFSSSTTVKY